MNIYSGRRNKIMKAVGESACVIVFSGKEVLKSEDEAYPFEVNRNFYYLTGIERADMILMMYKDGENIREYIFALPYSKELAKWVGGRMSFDEIKLISEVSTVSDASQFESTFASFYNRMRRNPGYEVYLDLWKYSAGQEDSQAVKFAKKIKDSYPHLTVKDLYPIITKRRLVKDEYEITCIRQALKITKVAFESMMKNIRPGMNELMMEAVFDYSLKSMMCKTPAFKTICASGKNATILHYSENNCEMQDGSLFLCDMGATFKNYCADISRTFPVNGNFSSRQKEIYDIVLEAQRIVEENARPGVTLRQLNGMVVDFYREELPKHGLHKDVSEYYMHGVSHHLGLDTHDVDLGAALQPGNVITNEPGLYIEDENIGIRIEDDLLITADGNENLAAELIKDPTDIENYMAN